MRTASFNPNLYQDMIVFNQDYIFCKLFLTIHILLTINTFIQFTKLICIVQKFLKTFLKDNHDFIKLLHTYIKLYQDTNKGTGRTRDRK